MNSLTYNRGCTTFEEQMVDFNICRDTMRLNRQLQSEGVLILCDRPLTSISCGGTVCKRKTWSVSLLCWFSTYIPVSSLRVCVCPCACVCVCLQLTPRLTFPPFFPSVKSFVLTRSSLYPLLNLFFMLPSLNLMGLSVCLSVSGSQPYHTSTKMTFREPLPVFPLS